MSDAVECALTEDRFPQSGPLMAWDTMAVLMAGYESAELEGRRVDIHQYTTAGRLFEKHEMPDPHQFGTVFQRH